MENNLANIVIENPRNMSAGYMLRDSLIALATLLLWSLCITKLYLFISSGPSIFLDHAAQVMLKFIIVSFSITLAAFHVWAIYNRWLYWRHLETLKVSPSAPRGEASVLAGESHSQAPECVSG